MSWTQQQEGYWSRPLDCHDRLFQFIGDTGKPLGREHWIILGAVQLDFPAEVDIVALLRNAWKVLRLQYPDIALELHSDEKRYSPIYEAGTLDAWCDLTFLVETNFKSSDELLQTLRVAHKHVTCHWIPASNQICLVASHWRWDGFGLIMVLNQLLAELEQPTTLPAVFDGSEAHRLIPSIDTIIEMPSTITQDWNDRADKLIANYTNGQPSIGLLPESKTSVPTLPSNTRRASIRIPAGQTLALRNACRTKGITLTPAIHASAVAETARANPSSPVTRYISWQPFDLRKYCPPPFNGPIHGASLRLVALPINVEARASWAELVQAIQPSYAQRWDLNKNDMMFVRAPYVEKGTAMMKAAAEMGMALPPPSEPVVSNLGVVDGRIKEVYGEVRVVDVAVMVSIITPQVTLHCWTWKGGLVLSASYNEAFYEEEDVLGWLGGVRDTLEGGLLGGI